LKNKKIKNQGFTLVELLVYIFVSSVLVLTMGMILYFCFLNWHRSGSAVELQRDGSIAMDMFSRAIRPASGPGIQTLGSTLTIDPIPIIGQKGKSFYLIGSSLWHDPDTATSGDEIELIKNKVSTLSFTINSLLHSVNINMILQDSPETVTLNSSIGYRV